MREIPGRPPRTGRVQPGIAALASGLLLLAATHMAAAQTGHTLAEGARVRVRPVESRATFVGTIALLARDTLVVDVERRGEPDRAFALHQLDRLELSQGRRNFIVPGAFVGALIVGLAAMTYNHLDTFSCTAACRDEPDLNTAAVAALGAAAGGVLGGLVKKERWIRISLPAGRAPR